MVNEYNIAYERITRVYVSTSSTASAVVRNAPVARHSAFFCNRDSASSTRFLRVLNPYSSEMMYHVEQVYIMLGTTTALYSLSACSRVIPHVDPVIATIASIDFIDLVTIYSRYALLLSCLSIYIPRYLMLVFASTV